MRISLRARARTLTQRAMFSFTRHTGYYSFLPEMQSAWRERARARPLLNFNAGIKAESSASRGDVALLSRIVIIISRGVWKFFRLRASSRANGFASWMPAICVLLRVAPVLFGVVQGARGFSWG